MKESEPEYSCKHSCKKVCIIQYLYVFLDTDSTKHKIVCKKITFLKQHVSYSAAIFFSN